MTQIKAALVQMRVTASKEHNLRIAEERVAQCAGEGADLVMLPEMFCCPYQTSVFHEYAEPEGGSVFNRLSNLARQHRIYLAGGSMPEVDAGRKIYNTCYLFDRRGVCIGKHRKMHLFDIDVSGGQRFKESETLSPGSQVTVVDTEFGRMGVAICYDVRFPELARLMALRGAQVLLVPGAFNMTTGPAHWEILFRTRALDNQVYALGCAPARDVTASYVSYGHSLVVSPWGAVTAQLGAEEGVLFSYLNLDEVARIRRELPLLQHRRTDLYELKEL